MTFEKVISVECRSGVAGRKEAGTSRLRKEREHMGTSLPKS